MCTKIKGIFEMNKMFNKNIYLGMLLIIKNISLIINIFNIFSFL